MNEAARRFYHSAAWRRVSKAYMQQHNYVCERCGKPAAICHHKHYLNPGNIHNPSVTLNTNNLECLCMDCHNKEHFAEHGATAFDYGLTFDAQGNIVKGEKHG